MQSKIAILKNIKITAILLLIGFVTANAQKVKIDGIAVVVGKKIVLDSDVQKFKKEISVRSKGKVEISDCEMLEQLMEQKLLAHHAVIDSVTVSKAEIDSRVDRSIQFFTQQYGSKKKVVAAYGFKDIEDLKKELGKVQKENILINKEQKKITDNIRITPEEVRIYYNGLKEKKELPKIPEEVQISQIVLYANPSQESINSVIQKLNQIKKEVENGDSFKLKAIINSDDPSVAQNGGQYTITKDSPFIKEFKEVAFSLDENQISEPFKTLFGYHIIKLHKIKGNQRVVSHILMQPKISDEELKETKVKISNIRNDITSGKINFEEAAKKYSQDKDTKNNGGLLIKPDGDANFDLTRMAPELYGRVSNLKKGQITEPFYDETRGGKKMYKIIWMRNRTSSHTADFVTDYVKIQQLALQKKKEEAIAKWSNRKIVDTYVKINDRYKKCQFKKNWSKKTKVAGAIM